MTITNRGILVKTRKAGNEITMPLPKKLSIKKDTSFLITRNNQGDLICRPQHKPKNIFNNPYYNRKNVMKFFKLTHMSIDQGRPVGKEW